MKVLRLLLKHATGPTVLAFALSGLGGLLSGASLLKLQALLRSEHVVLQDALVIGALGLSQIATSVVARFVFGRGLYEGVVAYLRRAVIEAVSASGLRAHERCGNARMWASIDFNTILIAFAGKAFVMAARSVTTVLACFVALAWKAPSLLPHALVAFSLGIGLFALVSRRAAHARAVTQTLSEVVDRHVEGLTKGNRELRQNAARRHAFMTDGLSPSVRAFQQKAASSSTWNAGAARLLAVPIMALIGGILFLSDLVATTEEQLSAFRSSIVLLLFLQAEISVLVGFVDSMRRGEIALGRIEGVLDELSTVEARGDAASVLRWSSITLDKVTSTYTSDDGSRQFTLGPVDLTLSPGEIVFVIGGNGSGKSTLAKVLTGLYRPDTGAVLLDGRMIGDESRESYRQLFSAIFAGHHVYRRLFGIEGSDVDARGRELLHALELDAKVDIKDRAYTTTMLSSGQRKRLSMVTARLEDRPILMFDEWASDQDPHFRDRFYRSILPELKKEGRTVVVISHDDRYFDAADRLVRLEDGRVVYDGKPPARTSTAPPRQEQVASNVS